MSLKENVLTVSIWLDTSPKTSLHTELWHLIVIRSYPILTNVSWKKTSVLTSSVKIPHKNIRPSVDLCLCVSQITTSHRSNLKFLKEKVWKVITAWFKVHLQTPVSSVSRLIVVLVCNLFIRPIHVFKDLFEDKRIFPKLYISKIGHTRNGFITPTCLFWVNIKAGETFKLYNQLYSFCLSL